MATGRTVDYLFGRRDSFTREKVNQIFNDIDRRLNGSEAIGTKIDLGLQSFLNDALARLDATVVSVASKFERLAENGFLIAESFTPVTLTVGDTPTITLPEGDERDLFQASEFIILTRKTNITDYAVLRSMSYDRETGVYQGEIIVAAGDVGPHADWELSSVAGSTVAMTAMTEAVAIKHAEVSAAAEQVAEDRAAVEEAITALESGAVVSVNGQGGIVNITAESLGAAPANSPTFTGTPAAPTPAPTNNSTRIATTSFVQTLVGPKANASDVYTKAEVDGAGQDQADFYG